MPRGKGTSKYIGPHWEHLVALPKGDPASGKAVETRFFLKHREGHCRKEGEDPEKWDNQALSFLSTKASSSFPTAL